MAHEKYAVIERTIVGAKEIVFLGTKKECQIESTWLRRQNRSASYHVRTEDEAHEEVNAS